MTNPVVPSQPVRLDDLIDAIKKVHSDALEQLQDAVIAADHLGDVATTSSATSSTRHAAPAPPGPTSAGAWA